MTKPIRDQAASVRRRLVDAAKERHRPTAEVLRYFTMEWYLYRPAHSPNQQITVESEYVGVRVTSTATLGTARVRTQRLRLR